VTSASLRSSGSGTEASPASVALSCRAFCGQPGTGPPWRPEEVGTWSSLCRRLRRRTLAGLRENILEAWNESRRVPDDQQHRDPRPSSGSRRKKGTAKRGSGRSRGGWATRIHLRVNGTGLPHEVGRDCGPDTGWPGLLLGHGRQPARTLRPACGSWPQSGARAKDRAAARCRCRHPNAETTETARGCQSKALPAAQPRHPEPSAPHARALQGRTCSSSWSSCSTLLKSWSLRKTRSGSWQARCSTVHLHRWHSLLRQHPPAGLTPTDDNATRQLPHREP